MPYTDEEQQILCEFGRRVRVARDALGWTQEDLHQKSKLAKKTIAAFETGDRSPHPSTLAALRTTLEAAGVVFIDDSDVSSEGGAGVRLRK